MREELISSASINKLVDLFFDNMEEKISFVTNLINKNHFSWSTLLYNNFMFLSYSPPVKLSNTVWQREKKWNLRMVMARKS